MNIHIYIFDFHYLDLYVSRSLRSLANYTGHKTDQSNGSVGVDCFFDIPPQYSTQGTGHVRMVRR